MIFEAACTVDSRDVDPFGQCRPSALLGMLQEAATEAACALHVSRDETLKKYNCFWMLARIWYRLERPLVWDERISIQTWHRGGAGASTYRDFDLYCGGEQVGEAVSVWVLADYDTHKLLRLSAVEEFQGTDGGGRCKELRLSKLRMPEEMALAEERLLRYSDADINGHVNNTRYADYICDALRLEELGKGKFVSQLQVGYLAECRPGERLWIHTGRGEEGWFVHGVDEAGAARFDGKIALSDCP